MPLRVVFMGTPRFAVPTLGELVAAGHELLAVYTQPPRAAGRGMMSRKSPVHEVAEGFGLAVRTPASLKPESETAELRLLQPDVVVVVAYGQILPRPILAVPAQGCLNLHASLLPRWRGAAPIQRAVMAGDAETGIAIMRMEAGLDTGPVALSERTAIGPDETAGDLTERMSHRGADLMARALAALSRGVLTFTPQSEAGVTYARKIDKGETRIGRQAADVIVDLSRRPAPVDPGFALVDLLGIGDAGFRLRREAEDAAR